MVVKNLLIVRSIIIWTAFLTFTGPVGGIQVLNFKHILKISSFILLCLLIPSCAHKPRSFAKAPSLNFQLGAINELPQSTRDPLIKYLEAQKAVRNGDAILACKYFEELYNDESFPLRSVAAIRVIEQCDYSKSDLEDLWDDLKDDQLIPTWAYEKFLGLSIQKAEFFKSYDYLHGFYFEMVNFKNVASEKEKLILDAIRIAKDENDSDAVEVYEKKLKIVSPRFETTINPQNIYSIAKDFEKIRKFNEARALYWQMINEDFSLEEKFKAYNAFRTTYKIERDLVTFNKATIEMEDFFRNESVKDPTNLKMQETWIDAKIALARALWTAHDNPNAKIQLTEILSKNLGSANQKALSAWVLGSIHIEEKNLHEAFKNFNLALSFKPTDVNSLENIQWSLVWTHYLQKNFKETISFANQFTKTSTNVNFTNKLFYWQGKAHQKIHETKNAEIVFEKILQTDPFNYYALLASGELKRALTPLVTTVESVETSNDEILDWLIAVNELDFAKSYQRTIDARYKTYNERIFAMKLYALTGWYEGAMRQISNFPIKMRAELTEKFHHLIYPQAYGSLVGVYAKKRNLPKSLILAIIRQESAFNPTVRSWADAFGLMQMIPEAATRLSQRFQIPYRDYNDLYDPEVNIAMGTALVSELSDKYLKRFIPIVASYNASEDAVQTWLRDRFNGDYHEFIELVPYEETRNYLKLVYRNMMIYERATKSQDINIDLDFFQKEMPQY